LRECHSIRSGAYGLPYDCSCASLVCVAVVIGGLAVWRHNNPKTKKLESLNSARTSTSKWITFPQTRRPPGEWVCVRTGCAATGNSCHLQQLSLATVVTCNSCHLQQLSLATVVTCISCQMCPPGSRGASALYAHSVMRSKRRTVGGRKRKRREFST